MNKMILTKFICIQEIWVNQNVNIFSNTIDYVYEKINDYNPNRKKKINFFDDMIADIMSNKKFQTIIKGLFIRYRKLNISLVFITQSYFSVSKDVRVNTTHYFIMKTKNKRELRNIAINHSVDIDYQGFKKIYKECAKEFFWQKILRYLQVIL